MVPQVLVSDPSRLIAKQLVQALYGVYAADQMLDASEILAFMYDVLDSLAYSLDGPRLFRSVYQVSWQHFRHTICQGMELAGYMEEARIHACAGKQMCMHLV